TSKNIAAASCIMACGRPRFRTRWQETSRSRPFSPGDLHFGALLLQNYKNVISGKERERTDASLRSMARPGPLPRLRPGDLLPRERWIFPRGEADLRRVSGSHRMPQLCPQTRRTLWGMGWHERTRTSTPEANGV